MKFCFTLLLAAAAFAQTATPPEGAAALKEALARNQAALRKYSWVETTQVSLKGEVKKQEQKQCSYGADGKVQKTAMAAAAGSAPAQEKASGGGGRRGGGRVKEKVVENKVDDMKEYMEKVVALVHQYVPPDAQKIQAAQAGGNLAVQPSGGSQVINVKNYLKSGDSLAIGLDPAAKVLTSYAVQSFVEKPKEDDVTLSVMFGKLEDGTSHPQQILLDVKAKNLQVKVTNSGYKKTAP
jgi:hypothetical protein